MATFMSQCQDLELEASEQERFTGLCPLFMKLLALRDGSVGVDVAAFTWLVLANRAVLRQTRKLAVGRKPAELTPLKNLAEVMAGFWVGRFTALVQAATDCHPGLAITVSSCQVAPRAPRLDYDDDDEDWEHELRCADNVAKAAFALKALGACLRFVPSALASVGSAPGYDSQFGVLADCLLRVEWPERKYLPVLVQVMCTVPVRDQVVLECAVLRAMETPAVLDSVKDVLGRGEEVVESYALSHAQDFKFEATDPVPGVSSALIVRARAAAARALEALGGILMRRHFRHQLLTDTSAKGGPLPPFDPADMD